MNRILVLFIIVWVSGCVDIFEGAWFKNASLDEYIFPNNVIPSQYIEEIEMPGTKVKGEKHAPTIIGIWAWQCTLADGCVTTQFPERQNIVVLYFHGYREHLDHYWDRVINLWMLGYTVFAVDYRGYGRSTGKPSEAGLYADARTTLEYLLSRVQPGTPIVYYGYSLGSTAAIQLATEQEPDALVLEATLASAQAFVDDALGLGVSKDTLMDTKFDNLGKIPKITAPKLIMHGTKDSFVRFKFGRMVFKAAAQPKEFIRVKGAEHTTIPCPSQNPDTEPEKRPCQPTPDYQEWVGGFLDKWLLN